MKKLLAIFLCLSVLLSLSACAKGESSHVLAAQGISRQLADRAVRVSMSHFTTDEDIDALIDAVSDGINKLVRRR